MNDDNAFNCVPNFDVLFNATLKAIRELGGSATVTEIAVRVIEELNLNPDILQIPHGDGRRTEVEYRLAWSRTYLKRYGLIDNPKRGVWSLTELGLHTKSVESTETEELLDNPPETIGDSSTETASWRDSLMKALLSMSPQGFERLCQRLLLESGFIEVKVIGRSGDGGIDGHGIIRLAGLIGFPVLFQCKRYSGTVPPKVVRDFRGAMVGRADKGLILTTGSFTKEANTEATREGAPPIDLIDGELLMDKLKELGIGVNVTTRTVEDVEVNSSFFESL